MTDHDPIIFSKDVINALSRPLRTWNHICISNPNALSELVPEEDPTLARNLNPHAVIGRGVRPLTVGVWQVDEGPPIVVACDDPGWNLPFVDFVQNLSRDFSASSGKLDVKKIPQMANVSRRFRAHKLFKTVQVQRNGHFPEFRLADVRIGYQKDARWRISRYGNR
jgi:hypothetical protein